jgi:hypothetical protein
MLPRQHSTAVRRTGAPGRKTCAWRAVRVVSVLLLWLPVPGLASTLETLIMPGPVIEDHADLESNCEQCHVPFTKKEQKVRCVICHNAVAADLLRERGYHGRDGRARTLECKFCHTEHVGRDADIVGLDEAIFDHQISDFALEGKHVGVACEGCHRRGEKHRVAPGECKACHEQDDVHRGRLGDSCADCHSAEGWRETAFDHSETDFALRGRHQKIPCEQCHANARYEGTPTECYACHKLNDAHGGRFGRECQACHRPAAWDDVSFDHEEETGFELIGKHREARCTSCHRGRLGEERLGTACIDCHKGDDSHRGKNGTRCDDCHLPNGWMESRFDHERESGFALKGEHGNLQCEACHRGALTVELSPACVSCHRGGDAHLGGLGEKCESCHTERSWDDVDFDHEEKTQFPLRESHATLKCQQCHLPSSKGRELSRNCFACHKSNDPHRGKLGKRCDQCHSEKAWRANVFFEGLCGDVDGVPRVSRRR